VGRSDAECAALGRTILDRGLGGFSLGPRLKMLAKKNPPEGGLSARG
jgi:hypothetical protein